MVKQVNQQLRKAMDAEGRISRLEGQWWQLSLTARTEFEPSAVSLLSIRRDRTRALEIAGRSWDSDGTLSARYWSEATKERQDPIGIFYFWKGERPRDPDAPELEGTGEIKLESVDRANGFWITRSSGARRTPRQDVRHLPARRPRRHGHPRRRRSGGALGPHPASSRPMEGCPERLRRERADIRWRWTPRSRGFRRPRQRRVSLETLSARSSFARRRRTTSVASDFSALSTSTSSARTARRRAASMSVVDVAGASSCGECLRHPSGSRRCRG